VTLKVPGVEFPPINEDTEQDSLVEAARETDEFWAETNTLAMMQQLGLVSKIV
jgi:hypothetical protein